MYQIITNLDSGIVIGIFRVLDSAIIPINPDNVDYQTYLDWVSTGNTASAYTP